MSHQPRADLVDVADQLLSRLTPPPPLSTGQIARIRTNIVDGRRKPVLRRGVIIAIAIALGGSSALAMYGVAVREQPDAPPAPAPRAPSVEHVAPAAPSRFEPPEPPPVARPPSEPRSAAVVTPPRPREGALGAESKLLAAALDQLRRGHDPKAALATLDRHAAEFPRGALAAEARTARIEALLASGDKHRALALLDAIAVGPELGVVRGELRLEAGRAEEAKRDFDAALVGTNDATEARALFGRAACRARLGDHAGARRDLEDYLRRFPDGKSALDARAAMERSR